MIKHTHVLCNRIRNGLLAMLMLSGFSVTSATLAADAKGSKDHPLVSRYEGSEIYTYKTETFNEYPLFINKISIYKGIEGQPSFQECFEWLHMVDIR